MTKHPCPPLVAALIALAAACPGAAWAQATATDRAIEKVAPQDAVFFDSGKATLRRDAREELDDLVFMLKGVNIVVIDVVGHADRSGSDAQNRALSLRRAQAVKSYLVSKGIAVERVQAEGRGAREPKKECANADRPQLIACLQANRRVEVKVQGLELR
jgi:OOP family OmpA-OmpF porin